jgi:hypothetical protein
MPELNPPAPARPPETTSLVTRLGGLVGLATAAALACAMPAALRVVGVAPAESLPQAWVALAASALAPMVLVVAVLLRARDGWRAFGGPGAATFVFGVAMWLGFLVVGLSVLGSMLRATTHHHALAGVTFAFGALAMALAFAAVCSRLVGILRSVDGVSRRLLSVALAVLAVLAAAAFVWLALGSAQASARDAASAAHVSTVVDDLAFLLAAALAARRATGVRRLFALIGPPAAVVVLAAGLPLLRSAGVREAIRAHAPTFEVGAELLVPGR